MRPLIVTGDPLGLSCLVSSGEPPADDDARNSSEAQPLALKHLTGAPALQASQKALLTLARARGDQRAEQMACKELARLLLAAGHDLASAVDALVRAVELGAVEHRSEALQLLEGTGRVRQAVELLTNGPEFTAADAEHAAKLLVLAGADDEALAVLERLPECRPGYAHAVISARAGRPDAAEGFVALAEQCAESGDEAESLEQLRRAFELAPGSSLTCEKLVGWLERAHRLAAADEVLRTHAAHASVERAAEVHARRLATALSDGDLSRALAAALDGRLEATEDEHVAPLVDELLERTGLHDALAVRLELQAARLLGTARALALTRLANIRMGRLASPDRAVEAWIEALATDPSNQAAREALRTHAEALGDQSARAEALIRAVQACEDAAVRASLLEELTALAQEHLAEPSLVLWALLKLDHSGGSDVAEARARLVPRVRLQDAALQAARDTATNGERPEEQLEGLRRVASILRGRPEDAADYLQTLTELVARVPQERRWLLELERCALRVARHDLLEQPLRALLSGDITRSERVHFTMLLVSLSIARGDYDQALEQARTLGEQLPGLRAAASATWILAALRGDDRLRAQALEHLAGGLEGPLRATILAVAGRLQADAGNQAAALELLSAAKMADRSAPRVAAFEAHMAAGMSEPRRAASLEKAWSVLVPSGQHCQALVEACEQDHEKLLAYAWTKRWLALRPWDSQVLQRMMKAAIATDRPEVVHEALQQALNGHFHLEQVAPWAVLALQALMQRDEGAAVEAAQLALDRLGPTHAPLRELVMLLAERTSNLDLQADLLERMLASGCESTADLHLKAFDVHLRRGDQDGASAHLLAAAQHEADPAGITRRLQQIAPVLGGDVRLACAHAEALVVEAAGAGQQAAIAWSLAGAASWDLASDAPSLVASVGRALRCQGRLTRDVLVTALVQFAGSQEQASQWLYDYGLTRGSHPDAAPALALAASLALQAERHSQALDYALQALERDPRCMSALLIVEQAADHLVTDEPVDRAYALVAAGARGRFGRRTAHHRAARVLEAKGRPELAIVHARAAFEADPTEGSCLATMMRIAALVEPADVIQTLERVAEAASTEADRSDWLKRAASLAVASYMHVRKAVDLALRALHAQPDPQAAQVLIEALRAELSEHPEDREILEMRLRRAAQAMTSRLEGPHGARVALLLASSAAGDLHSAQMANGWLLAALRCSGDIDEYDRLMPLAAQLAADTEGCQAVIDDVITRSGELRGTCGPQLLDLALALAQAGGDPDRQSAIEALRTRREQQLADQENKQDMFADLGETLAADDDDSGEGGSQQGSDSCEHDRASEAELQAQAQPSIDTPASAGMTDQEPMPAANEPAETPPQDAAPQPEANAPEAPLNVLDEAERHERTGRLAEAIAGLEEASVDGPATRLAVDQQLRRLYRATGRNSMLLQVLVRLAEQVSDAQEKAQVLMEAASLAEARADRDSARTHWKRLLDVQPGHEGALAFLERDAVERGDYRTLAELLLSRAGQCTSVEEERAARLRRAVVLDERLGQSGQACAELDELLTKGGDHASVLRVRAQLAQRLGDAKAAAPYWVRAARVVGSNADAVGFAVRAARAYLDAGDLAGSRQALEAAGDDRALDVLRLRAEIERRSGRHLALADTLDEIATAAIDPPLQRANMLIEAAHCSLEHGEQDRAVERAVRAARLAPDEPSVILQAVLIQYRVEGLPDPRTAHAMMHRLEQVAGRVKDDERALHAFLYAEAMEVVDGRQAAIDLLTQQRRELGLVPLVALGMAERVAAGGDAEQALPLFDTALQAQNLYGLRTRAQVAYAAARVALRSGGASQVLPYLEAIEQQPDGAELATRLRTEMAALQAPSDEMRRQLDRVARETVGVERAQALGQLARMAAARATRSSLAEAIALLSEAMAACGSDLVLKARLEAERTELSARMTRSNRPPAPSTPPPPKEPSPSAGSPAKVSPIKSVPPPAPVAEQSSSDRPPAPSSPPPPKEPSAPAKVSPIKSVPPPAPVAGLTRSDGPPAPSSSPPPKEPGPSAGAPAKVSPIKSVPPPAPFAEPSSSDAPARASERPAAVHSAASEEELYTALEKGSVQAGDELAARLARSPDRTPDLVAVRRRQVVLEPWNTRSLKLLRDAAAADHNVAYARAVEHALSVLSRQQEPIAAPMLADLANEPERVLAMITRGVHTEVTEVFGCIWESVPHLFAREPSSYGITGLQRVGMHAHSPVAQAYAVAARALALARTPVFHLRNAGPTSFAVAVLQQPAVVVSGEPGFDSELVYRMAAMLMATVPVNVLLFALPADAVRTVADAVMAAFGPPESAREKVASTAMLAGEMWRSMPGRAQRRVQDVVARQALRYEDAWSRALQSTRRAGLFACGDLATALRDVMNDPGMREAVNESSPDGWSTLVRTSPSAADLVRFATSAEYAEARWRSRSGSIASPSPSLRG